MTSNLVFVFVRTVCVVMSPAIDNPASFEIYSVIVFLNAKNIFAVEIYCELCAVYGQNVMSERTVRQWCIMFKDGRTNVQNEERSGRPAICSE
jgi:hypothetical protein